MYISGTRERQTDAGMNVCTEKRTARRPSLLLGIHSEIELPIVKGTKIITSNQALNAKKPIQPRRAQHTNISVALSVIVAGKQVRLDTGEANQFKDDDAKQVQVKTGKALHLYLAISAPTQPTGLARLKMHRRPCRRRWEGLPACPPPPIPSPAANAR